MSARHFIRVATEMQPSDIEDATSHPAVSCVSVDRGPTNLCRPCVEIDPVVAAMLARAGFEHVAREAEMERIEKEWKPS